MCRFGEGGAAFGGDADRITILGDSAGGNLAASVVNRARDAGEPAVRAQVLLCPRIDPIADTTSRREYAEGYVIHPAALEWFGAQYITAPRDVTDLRLAVNRSSAAGLPPTLILTNQYDTLRCGTIRKRLREAGVEVYATAATGWLVHGVYWMSSVILTLHGAAIRWRQATRGPPRRGVRGSEEPRDRRRGTGLRPTTVSL